MTENTKKNTPKMTQEEAEATLLQSTVTGMRFHPYLSEKDKKRLEKESKLDPLTWLDLHTSRTEKSDTQSSK